VLDECENCLTMLRHTNDALSQMVGAGGAQPLTETALGHMARVLAHNPSGGARNKWLAELALELLLKRRAAGAARRDTICDSQDEKRCRVQMEAAATAPKFMEYMRQYYPDVTLQEPFNATRPDHRTPPSPSETDTDAVTWCRAASPMSVM
jgi:hypothetical protein